MSEEEQPKEKTETELRNEYLQLCSELGNLEYIIRQRQIEAHQLHARMHELNLQGEKLKKGEADVSK